MKVVFMHIFKVIFLAGATLFAAGVVGAEADQGPTVMARAADVDAAAAMLRDQALNKNVAYAWLTQLTTRFGARMAGSASERKAAEWAAGSLESMGFDTIKIEPFDLQLWQRGAESAEILSPFPQKLVVTALGGSRATPPEGVDAEATLFATYQEFLDSKVDLKGRIVVVLQPTARTQTGVGYGLNSGSVRSRGPLEAKQRGASAFLMRALGTETHRFAHAGATQFQTKEGIPSLAMSPPDAEAMLRMKVLQDKGEAGPLRIKIVSTPRFLGGGQSQNVIAEFRGMEKPDEIITIGGHLDSWDLGTGAIDDGSGMAITLAAVKTMIDAGKRPRRTIRVVLYGAEEVSQPDNKGLSGAQAYADRHVNPATRVSSETHILTAESDFGADVIYAASMPVASQTDFNARLGKILYPLKVYVDPKPADGGGPDTLPSQRQGVPAMDLRQNGMDYFDTHHTADDVLERIEPAKLDQNVAAWTATLWLVANGDVTFNPQVRK